jgi:hypothetical protein
LLEHRGAQFDAFPADVDFAWPFYQWTDIPIAFATKRAVLLGVIIARGSPAGHYILT